MEQEYTFRCRSCASESRFTLEPAAVDAWKKGALIQHMFPHLNRTERELMISGTCGPCFDRLFGNV